MAYRRARSGFSESCLRMPEHACFVKLSLNPTVNLESGSLGVAGSLDKEFLKGSH